ncbi:MAG TPA: rhomboid family intramembrane serine protease [Solirubrobacterales bacterium]|nr:rhomboid family intramembrane serine protease [Solirubrobacterales bacterium]
MASPELSVVCKSCGSEVSPYVTECPYCGTRLRKRAPKLERRGDEIAPREPRRRLRRPRIPRVAVAERPYATIAAVLAPAMLLLVQRAADLSPSEVGAIVGPVDSEWWRYLAAPFTYDDLGYLFVVAVAVAVFVPSLERRLGTVAAVLLMLACGALGMLGASAMHSIGLDSGTLLAAGGNGLALGAVGAWFAIRYTESRASPDEDFDLIGVTVCAAVLLALPLVEDFANVWAGIAGGVVGLLAGFASRPGEARGDR